MIKRSRVLPRYQLLKSMRFKCLPSPRQYTGEKQTITTIDNVPYLNQKKFNLSKNGHDDIKRENF